MKANQIPITGSIMMTNFPVIIHGSSDGHQNLPDNQFFNEIPHLQKCRSIINSIDGCIRSKARKKIGFHRNQNA